MIARAGWREESIDHPTAGLYGRLKAEALADNDTTEGAELAVIPRAGHLSNMEQPEAFDAYVRRFCLANPAA
jgi:pimeloyl-ACP methyl ester carboxylesterase